MSDDVRVREATPSDLPGLLSVLDAAALETEGDRTRASVERGDALVAVADPRRSVASVPGEWASEGVDTGDAEADGTVVGSLVLDGAEISAVAVRRRRRDQGVGTALVEAAAERVAASQGCGNRPVAEFDADVRPFYERLGFAVEPTIESGRYRGRLE